MGLAFILLLSIGEFFGISYVFACIIFMIVYPFLLIYIHIYGDKVFNFFYKKMIDKSLAMHELVGKNEKLQPDGSSNAVKRYIKKMTERMQFFYSFIVALVFLSVGASALLLPRNIVGDISTHFLGSMGWVAAGLFFGSMFTSLKWNSLWKAMYNQYFEVYRQAKRVQDNTFGSAKFEKAIPKEYDAYEIGNKSNMVYLGNPAFLNPENKKHIITFAPTRAGKGSCLILPNLLYSFENSYVVLDIKGENAAVSARHQKKLGKDVVIIDPWNLQEEIGATHGIPSVGFNPLVLMEGLNDRDLVEAVSALIDLACPMPKDIKDPYWAERARVLIRGLLLYHLQSTPQENWSLLAVYKMLRSGDDALMANIAFGAEKNELAADDLNQFKGKKLNESPFTSIVSQAQSMTDFIRSTAIAGDFNPKQLNEKPTAVYICIPDDQVGNNYTWLRMVIGYCLRGIKSNVKNRKVERTLFLLDEAHYLGDMKEIKTALATSAGYGVCIWQFYQDIGQVQAAYEKSSNSVINAGVKQFYKVTDLDTAKYVSELLGNRTLELSNRSINADGKVSTSESLTGARLILPEQVGNYQHIITIMDGKNYLLEAVPYYDKEVFDFFEYDPNPLV